MQNGEPQFAGSNTGDPGLSSAMAEMHADWLVLKGRLGFNNPGWLRHNRLIAHGEFPHPARHEQRRQLAGNPQPGPQTEHPGRSRTSAATA